MSAPTTTRKTRTRRHNIRLPRLGWWWLLVAATAFGIAKTWPVITGATVVLLAIGAITAARRPAWLQRATRHLPTIGIYRPALGNRGRRTLADFQRMNPTRFEHAIAELAREDPRVTHAQRVGGANDRGADVLITLNNGYRILIQCKKYRPGKNVGSETLQTINGVYRDIHGCHQAVIVTTAAFTASAYDTNARFPQPIRLVDGHHLEAWANGTAPAPW